jgi:four helix bundle protein
MDSYKELEVWQKAIDLVGQVYTVSRNFPGEEKFGLISQMQRAAVSIPANIAEGWGRSSTLEYIHFLKIAKGSVLELETHIIIAERLKYLDSSKSKKLISGTNEILRMLSSLITSLKSRIPNS